jgi:predicted dehydrogenase
MKIAIVGAGQLGSRHIQGALKVESKDIHIDVIEPDDTATKTSKQRNKEIDSEVSINYHKNIASLNGLYEAVIISTNANNRLYIIKELFNQIDTKVLILEKVVFQSAKEFDELDALLEDKKTKVYVNHPRRMYSFYEELKSELQANRTEITHINVSGNDWGLACNGLHFIDLVSYLTGSKPTTILNNKLTEITASKRKGFIEINGHLWINFENRSSLLISSLKGNNKATSIEIISPEIKYHIEEGGRSIITRFINSKWQSDTPIRTPFQSELTKYLIEDILIGKELKITPLLISKGCHTLFLESLKDFVNDKTGKEYKQLPIT